MNMCFFSLQDGTICFHLLILGKHLFILLKFSYNIIFNVCLVLQDGKNEDTRT